MNFELDEDQNLLRDSVRRWTEKEYGFEQRRAMVEAGGFAPERWREFADMGWLAVGLPEAQGGYGGLIETALVAEELGRSLVLEPYLACAALPGRLLSDLAGDDAEALLAPLLSGEALYAVAHAEAAARGRSAWVGTQARRVASGYRLDGEKCAVVGAADADRFLLTARLDGAAGDEAGIGLFLVERGTPGVSVRDYRLVDGSRAADLQLDAVALPATACLGESVFEALDRALCALTVCCSAEMLGAMDQALWITRDYLNTRKQFGVLIGSFQVLQHRMADMYIALEQARSILYRGLAYAESEDAGQRRAAVSETKAQLGRCAQFVAAQAVQLHGGVGVTEEYSIGHYFKRLLVLEATYGSSAYHYGRLAGSLG